MSHLKILTLNMKTYTFSFLWEYRLDIQKHCRRQGLGKYGFSVFLVPVDVLQVKVKMIKMPAIDFGVYWGCEEAPF